MSWTDWAERECDALRAAGRWRQVHDFDARGPLGRAAGVGPVISFASNDYLGLSFHSEVVVAARGALERWGAGAGAARLVVGSRPVHTELEVEIARWKKTEACVLFSSGFSANLGLLATFGGPGTLICSDELNHASIIDGCRLARGRVAVYPHKDVSSVARLLEEAARDGERALVVSDTVFSMDGDIAPVDELAQLCREHGALLVLDEAHAVLGPHPELNEVEVLRVGTLSKFLGALGGFVAGSRALVELLINRARSFIFTTALSPPDAAAALAALRVLRSAEGELLQERLRSLIARLAPGHPSPIVPVVLGDERRALEASERLLERGLLVPAIRPPSVAPGTSRLRVALSAAHTEEQVARLAAALGEVSGGARLESAPRRASAGANTTTAPATRPFEPGASAPAGPQENGRGGSRAFVVVVSGTATGVGKTWTAVRLIEALRGRGVAASARKPAQSSEGDGLSDAELLASASGEPWGEVCPAHRTYARAMAPPMAADALGLPPFSLAELLGELALPQQGLAFIEGVGGPRSPISHDADTVSVAEAVAADLVVLVAEAGLGAINAVALARSAFGPRRVVVFLNRFEPRDELHTCNRAWLERRLSLDVTTTIDELAEFVGALFRRARPGTTDLASAT